MSNTPNNDKTKPKKKSIVARLVYFASHTARINKKSEKRSSKKKQKSTEENVLTDTKRKFSKSLIELNKEGVHACTFCDFCDKEMITELTGQNIICHESCKENHKPELLKEYSTELQLLGSIKSDKNLIRETSFSVYIPETEERKLSITLKDININGFTLCDEETLKMRKGPPPLGDIGFLSDTSKGSYTFSTVDLPTIKQFGISIKNVTSIPNEYSIVENQMSLVQRYSDYNRNSSLSFFSLLPENLRKMISIFNDNNEGLSIEPNGEQIMGKMRVHMNLLRPIKMLLTARPPSVFDLFPTDTSYGHDQCTLDRAYHNTESIFWLPRGTSKVLYININCPTMDVISILLAKFNIRNNPKKFALYEHTIKSSTEMEVRKLRLLQCPLKMMLDWCSKDGDYFHRNLETKRFVLQENDPGSIEWEEFSIPELRSFLTILAQEEAEKRRSIECKYDILRTEIHRRMTLKRSVRQETISVHL